MRFFRFVTLFALVLVAVSCGLPSSYYLSPPTLGPGGAQGDPTSGFFQILSTSANSEEEFRGFELYYKFDATAPTGTEINLGNSTNDVTTLTNAGFLTVCSGDSTRDATPTQRTLPLIPIQQADRGTTFSVTINVNPQSPDATLVNYTYTAAAAGTVEVQIDRHVFDTTTGGCKPFTFIRWLPGNYSTADADMTNLGTLQSSTIYLVMYAVSYGLQDVSTPIYSYPVYLGYLTLSSF